MKAIPDKASDLLELALDDVQAVQRRKGVELAMDYWLVFGGDGTCTVCMAGAVMLRSLGVEPEESSFNGEVDPCDIGSDSIAGKLCRINNMRCGVFGTGDMAIELKLRRLVRSSFSDADGRAPWRVYRKCVRILREHGL